MMTEIISKDGLYIHIPFCLSKCGYCSFYSVTSRELIDEFVKAVVQEITFYKDSFGVFDTIYLGGGTPSLLSILQLDKILHSAHNLFRIDGQAEVTIEVNPGDISIDYLRSLRDLGINRLNIGVQSFDDQILKFLGRRHSAHEAFVVIDLARKAGFDNIGIDLIYGVFGQDVNMWQQTMKQALSFAPAHLSCYQLSLDPQAPLYRKYRQERLSFPPENEALAFFMKTSNTLTDAGFIHYEVSNFARSDSMRSRHNIKYWRHIPYLGLGPAAHSFKDRRRWWNKANISAYLKSIFNQQQPLEQSEELSLDQLALEAFFLGLRTKDGLNLAQYKASYGLDLLSIKKRAIEELIQNKLVELKDGSLCPTLDGMAVADSLALI